MGKAGGGDGGGDDGSESVGTAGTAGSGSSSSTPDRDSRRAAARALGCVLAREEQARLEQEEVDEFVNGGAASQAGAEDGETGNDPTLTRTPSS